MITPEHEQVQRPAGTGASESVTYAWGDPERGSYGSVRFGLAGGQASVLVLVFSGDELAASTLLGGVELPDPDWRAIDVEGATATIDEPLGAWRVRHESEDAAVDLAFEAVSAPLAFTPDMAAADAAGLEGYEQLCRVSGTVRTKAGRREVSGLGQRGHQWGAPDWETMRLSRTVSAWCGPDRAVVLGAVRPDDAEAHGDEAASAWLVLPGEEGPEGTVVAEARLSTTYDGDGRQRRAGLELWPDEDGYPIRAAGEVVCGTTLLLGRLTLQTAFFSWSMAGVRGVGRYDLLRREG